MTSLFSKDTMLSGSKRLQRSRVRKPKASNWKDLCPLMGKPLHAVPEVAEEEEVYYQQTFPTTPSSCSSQVPCSASRNLGGSSTLGPRRCGPDVVLDIRAPETRATRPRPVGFTGAEEFSLKSTADFEYESPRPAPRPPLPASSPTSSSSRLSSYDSDVTNSPDSLNLRFSDIGLVLDFPQPPRALSPSRREPSRSPTPSLMSSCTSRTSGSNTSLAASSIGIPTTPVTSDDEFPPSPLSKAAPARPLQIAKKDVECHVAEEDDWIDDDGEWYKKQFEDILTLCSPLPAAFREPSSPVNIEAPAAARPESLMPVSRRCSSMYGKPACPSAQLDPTFPVRRRSAIKLPNRPPPPVPSARRRSRSSQSSVANAVRSAKNELTITIPARSRPPPRMSVPADVSDVFGDLLSPEGHGVVSRVADGSTQELFLQPETPSVYSQNTDSADGDFYASPLFMGVELPLSPIDLQLEIATTLEQVQRRGREGAEAAMPDTPVGQMYSPHPTCSEEAQERPLRSRWSSSTLSSIAESQPPMSASSRILRFNFSPRRGKTREKAKSGFAGLMSPKPVSERGSFQMDFNYAMDSRTLGRRGSRSSNASDSAESCDSAGSNGLRRKPIPVEMFIRC